MAKNVSLIDEHFHEQQEYLSQRGLLPHVVTQLGLKFCGPGMLGEEGITWKGVSKGILWRIRDFNGEETGAVGARVWYQETFGKLDRPKFATPKDQTPRLYHSPLADWKKLEYGQPIVLCESYLKADVAALCGFHAIGISGVWGWSHKKAIIDDFSRIPWKDLGLKLVVSFDSNVGPGGNELLTLAVERLAAEMDRLDGRTFAAYLPKPNGGGDWGLDDYYVAHGRDAVAKLLIDGLEKVHSGITQHMLVMNREVAVVQQLTKIVDIETGVLMSRGDFMNVAYAPRKAWGEDGKPISIAKCWLEWSDRTEVERVVFKPGQERLIDGNYNIWRGMGCGPNMSENIRLWTEWLECAFPRESERHWFCSWWAVQLQNLGIKLTTSLVLVGVSGVGKGWVSSIMKRIFGRDNCANADLMSLGGRFNSDYAMKQLLIVEESELPGWNGDMIYNKVKDLITNEQIRVEPKGVNAYMVDNCVNIMLQGNKVDIFKLDEFDRRMAVLELDGSAIANNDSFWEGRWSALDSGLCSGIYQWLLDYDIGNFNPFGMAPMTAAKEAMIETTHAPREQWISELRQDAGSVMNVLGVDVDCSVATAKELEYVYQGGAVPLWDIDKKSADAMSRALRSARFPMANEGNKIKVGGVALRYFLLNFGLVQKTNWAELVEQRKFWKQLMKGSKV